MREIPEPDRDEWIARLRERARQDAEELVPQPGFAVCGLVAPVLTPGTLMEAAQVNGTWQRIGLAYGDPLAASGPLVEVTTMRRGIEQPEPASDRDLRQYLDETRHRIADRAGAEAEEPAGPPTFGDVELIVDGSPVRCRICTHGSLWAALLTAPELIVLVDGRDVEPGAVHLDEVQDLAPFVRARNEMIGRYAERRREQPEPVLPPAEGVAAYRALVDPVLDGLKQRMDGLEAGRSPRHPAADGLMYRALWRRAVREQQRLSGCDRSQADDIVTRVVNHLGQLAEEADWFSADAVLREAAIDETLRYSVLGEDVRSAEAQRAWAAYWTHRLAGLGQEPIEALHAAMDSGRPLVGRWLEAWAAWTRQR